MKKRRILSILAAVILVFGILSNSVIMAEGTQEATREYTVNAFVTAIGSENMQGTPADLTTFEDYPSIDPEYVDALSVAVGAGLLKGYEDNTIRPKNTIKRVEALVLLSRALPELSVTKPDATFSDIPSWAVTDVERLAQAELVLGYGNGLFGAEDLLTVEQVGFLIDRLKAQIPASTGYQKDFYDTVNREYIETAKIPDSYPETSVMTEVSDKVYYEVADIVNEMLEKKNVNIDSTERKMQNFFYNLCNTEMRNDDGIEPILPLLTALDSVKTLGDLNSYAAQIQLLTGMKLLHGFEVNVMDGGTYRLYYSFGDYGLSKFEMDGSANPNAPAAYQQYMEQLFLLGGYSNTKAKASAKAIFDMQADWASAAMDPTKVIDPNDYYTKMSGNDIAKLVSKLNVKDYWRMIGMQSAKPFTSIPQIMVCDQTLIKKMNTYLTDKNLPLLKDYCRVQILMQSARYLTDEFLQAYNAFYNARFGTSAKFKVYDFAMSTTQDYFGMKLGEKYVKQYFSEKAKTDVEGMISEIITSYRKQISSCAWMSDETKSGALKKLDAMNVKVGYPETFSAMVDYLPIYDSEDAPPIINIFNLEAMYAYNDYRFIDEEVDKDSFPALPQMVNAFYRPGVNQFVIPAGILQAPFYDVNASREENLGGIGVVIAHEISHAFDKTGSLYNEKGERKNWWKAEDTKKYDEKTKMLVEQFSSVEVLPGYFIDGERTLNENVADLAAVGCVLDMVDSSNPKLHLLFENYARIWASVEREEYTKLMLSADVHAPHKYRVNTILPNFQAFMDCYSIRPMDDMYRAPEKRVSIW